MGTRNLTCAILDGEYRVAQYGQWDGYLSGVGQDITDFLVETIKEDKLEAFKAKLRGTEFLDGDELDRMWKAAGASSEGWIGFEESKKFGKSAVGMLMTRDTGGKIFSVIAATSLSPIPLSDQREFAKDGLFCEYAYVVDFDNEVLEVYKGFGTEPLDESERFYAPKPTEYSGGTSYWPVRLWFKVPFADLVSSPSLDDWAPIEADEE